MFRRIGALGFWQPALLKTFFSFENRVHLWLNSAATNQVKRSNAALPCKRSDSKSPQASRAAKAMCARRLLELPCMGYEPVMMVPHACHLHQGGAQLVETPVYAPKPSLPR